MSFVPAIIGGLASAAASPVGAAVIGAGIAAGSQAMMSGGKGGSMPSLPELPQPPSMASTESKAQDSTRRRAAADTKTVYTSPLGVDNLGTAAQANIARKTLLGQ